MTKDLKSKINKLLDIVDENVDGGITYYSEDDSCGSHSCCFGRSYVPHTPDCYVTKIRQLSIEVRAELKGE